MRYNREEKIFITKKYTILRSATLVQRAWRSKFTVSNAPGRSTILNLAKKFNKTGSIDNLNGKNRNISKKRKSYWKRWFQRNPICPSAKRRK